MATLKIGDKAPEFDLIDQHNKTVSSSDFKGKKLLIYFYPKANTPGCTTQSCSVRDSTEDLSGLAIDAVGISPDGPDKQLKFDEKFNLKFPLLSDPDHEVAEAYGAWGEKKNYGKTYMGIIRSSFLVDEAGKIAQVAYKVKPADTVPKAKAAVDTA